MYLPFSGTDFVLAGLIQLATKTGFTVIYVNLCRSVKNSDLIITGQF